MLAHAASAQGISAVENICDRPYILNHNSVPAACFTHPEVRCPGDSCLGVLSLGHEVQSRSACAMASMHVSAFMVQPRISHPRPWVTHHAVEAAGYAAGVQRHMNACSIACGFDCVEMGMWVLHDPL